MIDVIIPTYNRALSLKKVIPSYLEQDDLDVCIIVDDCSTDSTETLVLDLIERYPNKIIECNYFSYTDDSGDVWEELSFFESLNKSYPFVSLSTLIIASENNDKLENYLFLK